MAVLLPPRPPPLPTLSLSNNWCAPALEMRRVRMNFPRSCNEKRVPVASASDCKICYCPLEEGEGTKLYFSTKCHTGQNVCLSCWENHLTLRALSPRCILCTKPLTYADMRTLKNKGAVSDKVWRLFLEERRNRELRSVGVDDWIYCPTPDCGEVLTGSRASPKIRCTKCSQNSCFIHQVGWEHHSRSQFLDQEISVCGGGRREARLQEPKVPSTATTTSTSLSNFSASSVRQDSGSGSVSWINNNTKNCPQCKVPIQKAEGCNHMTCGYCSYEWWWCCQRSFHLEAAEHYKSCQSDSLFGDEDYEDNLFGAPAPIRIEGIPEFHLPATLPLIQLADLRFEEHSPLPDRQTLPLFLFGDDDDLFYPVPKKPTVTASSSSSSQKTKNSLFSDDEDDDDLFVRPKPVTTLPSATSNAKLKSIFEDEEEDIFAKKPGKSKVVKSLFGDD